MKYLIFLWIPFWSLWGLAVDEKLPLRLLKVSDSKKTVLINRGIEDGLVVGDHARFFLTTGVVARGVVVKVAPSRSVWSLYRVIQEEALREEEVMNLKVTLPVKLSQDPTKMFSDQGLPKTPEGGITLPETVADMEKNLSDEERGDLQKLQSNLKKGAYYPHKSDASLEVWSLLHLSALTSKNSLGAGQEGSRGKNSLFSLYLGLEKYFSTEGVWYSRLTLRPLLHYERQQSSSIDGSSLTSSVFEYGGGVAWHFLHHPLFVGEPIAFIEASVGLGKTTDKAVVQYLPANTPGYVTGSTVYEGRSQFFSMGVGMKYYFQSNFGLRVIADYYYREERYVIANSIDSYTKIVSGPRFLLGLSYRW